MKILSPLAAFASLSMILTLGAEAQHYTQVNLVANTSGIAPVTDPNLVNPWGLSRSSGSAWWVADTGSGFSTLYNGAGSIIPLVVTIPKSDPKSTIFSSGTATGTVFNGSPTDFLVGGKPAAFLFATIDGTLSAWNPAVGIPAGGTPPSTQAIVVFKTADGSSYTGLTEANLNGKHYLYAANFGKGKVDVFDSGLHPVTLNVDQDGDRNRDMIRGNDRDDQDQESPFTDQQLPHNYDPFNVQSVGNDVVVTFALHPQGSPFELAGRGLGYVDIFSASGRLLLRLQHGDWLNAPWGVAVAPLDFGVFSHDLLIGQFAGSSATNSGGTIAAYDLITGAYKGQVKDPSGKVLSIPGLWSISPGNGASAGSYDASAAPASALYFTAGPDEGKGGLFGYLKPVATDLVRGNNQ